MAPTQVLVTGAQRAHCNQLRAGARRGHCYEGARKPGGRDRRLRRQL